MNQFEEQVRDALRREEPSADFANQVLARIQAETRADRAEVVPFPRRGTRRRWLAAAAAALIASMAGLALTLGGFEPRPVVETRINSDIEPPSPADTSDVQPAPSVSEQQTPIVSDPAPRPRVRHGRRSERARLTNRRPRRDDLAERLHAKEQVMRALAITSTAMSSVQRKVSRQQREQPTSQRRSRIQHSR